MVQMQFETGAPGPVSHTCWSTASTLSLLLVASVFVSGDSMSSIRSLMLAGRREPCAMTNGLPAPAQGHAGRRWQVLGVQQQLYVSGWKDKTRTVQSMLEAVIIRSSRSRTSTKATTPATGRRRRRAAPIQACVVVGRRCCLHQRAHALRWRNA